MRVRFEGECHNDPRPSESNALRNRISTAGIQGRLRGLGAVQLLKKPRKRRYRDHEDEERRPNGRFQRRTGTLRISAMTLETPIGLGNWAGISPLPMLPLEWVYCNNYSTCLIPTIQESDTWSGILNCTTDLRVLFPADE